jgi:hypothetical protein
MATASSKDSDITFDGSNWEALPRLVTQAKLALLLDSQVADSKDQSAWLAARFRGAALDWLGQRLSHEPALLDSFDLFVIQVQQGFGVTDDGLQAHRRGQLEALKWCADLPVFFADFDRLTTQLNISGNSTRIALVRNKLPTSVQKLLAEQALDFANYETMRERLLTMWALDPNRQTAVTPAPSKKGKPRCGRCGKKGHTAPDCRTNKN